MEALLPQDQTDKGYVLKDGYSWDAILNDGKKNGKVIVKDKEGCVSNVLQYENDKLNGICEFYDAGILVERRTFVNDVAEGWACRIEYDDEVEWFLYDNGRKSAKVERYNDLENYWKVIDIESNATLSVCNYDENRIPIGKGYIFEDGNIKRVVMFENGKEKEVLKSFNQGEMIVFDNGIKIYKGGFADDLSKDYPREGIGKEYCDGIVMYMGEWKNNKKDGRGHTLKNGFAEYDGGWKNDLPHGFGLLKRDGKSYKGYWLMGKLQLDDGKFFDYVSGLIVVNEIQNSGSFIRQPINVPKPNKYVKVVIENTNQLSALLRDEKKRTVDVLVIEEGCGNEIKDNLELCGFEKLKSLTVKKNALMNLNSLKISDNPMLKSIQTEDDYFNAASFNNVKSVMITSTLFDD